jgi:hypothetical protein
VTQNELNLLAEIARLNAKITAYEDALDEIASCTECKRARALAWGVLSDQEEAA